MWILLLLPFVIQAVAIGLDEGIFHIKRGLPKWERLGHPIDTFTVLACFLFVFFVPYSREMLNWYIGIAIFSCIMITKDEFVHKHHCPATEQYLHAFLFINHPIMLASLGFMWSLIAEKPWITPFLIMQIATISLFCLYQIIYWNFIYAPDQQ